MINGIHKLGYSIILISFIHFITNFSFIYRTHGILTKSIESNLDSILKTSGFALHATKPKNPKSGSSKGGTSSKATSQNAPKKKKVRISKSELGAQKARAKAKREMKKKKAEMPRRTKVSIEEEDKEEMEREYQKRIAMTDTKAYTEKLSMDLTLDEDRPYMSLFDEEIITKDDLLGFDMPYGLIPLERYELWKLCGRISDPSPPFSSQSLTTRGFTQRLFGNQSEISRDDFNYKIEYKMKFYTPGYGDIFFMDKIRCWRAYYLSRDYKYGPEDLPTYSTIYPIPRPEDSVELSKVMLAVNCEINRQGVHPALLDMLWNFFKDNEGDDEVLTRDLVTYKLNWIIERLENRDEFEGISPDNFYRIFYEKGKEYIQNFDQISFIKNQLKNLHTIDTHKMLMMNNSALRKRNKLLKDAYNEELRSLYRTKVPRTYIRYERMRIAGYFNMLNHMYEVRERRKTWVKPEEPKPSEPLSHEDELFEREFQKYSKIDQRKREMKRRKDLRSRTKK